MQRVVKPKTKVFRIRAAQLIMIAEWIHLHVWPTWSWSLLGLGSRLLSR